MDDLMFDDYSFLRQSQGLLVICMGDKKSRLLEVK